ncbi:MAG: 2-pyrone-4,6-dicarboxylate hydrolase [Betaproteobacteria bacterium]|nr:MAG: 2-pyrone-4,6-dicarboxylate hydrolase [Betaproteobacteria bacterium]
MTTVRAVDSHAHVFCGDRYLYSPDTLYQPHPSQAGTAAKFRAVLDAHGLTHGLLVGAGPYGPDNRCMFDAIAASGGRFKGIALVKAQASDRELSALADQGVVGIRMNLMGHGMRPLTEPGAARLLARVKEMKWLLQVHCQKDELAEAAPLLRQAGVRVMIDHFGRPDIKRGVSQPGFSTLLEFGKSGNAVVKLSGPFRSSLEGYPYRDVDPFIAAAIEAFTLDNCVWGSDWPYVRMDERMDYGPPLTCLARWLPDAKDRQTALWDSPARLFGLN